MRASKSIAGLLLYIAFVFPQHAPADTFCTVSADGKIHTDDCGYTAYDKCKQAVGSGGTCIVDQKDPSTEPPYCVVTRTVDCKYYDYESCQQAAEKNMGYCFSNSKYKVLDN